MTQETPIDFVDTLYGVYVSFWAHDEGFGTEYKKASEGFLTPEEVRNLKEQAVVAFRKAFQVVGIKSEPKSDNPTDELKDAFAIKAFADVAEIEEMATKNTAELSPLLEEIKKIGEIIDADNKRLANDPVSTGTLITGNDDLPL